MFHDAKYRGRALKFFVENPSDVIQKRHVDGRFFEVDDLEYHATLIPFGGIVLDVGANIGNHSIYYGKFTRAAKVFPFEPNPTAQQIFLKNMEANKIAKIDLAYFNYGVADRSSAGKMRSRSKDNLGSTMIDQGEGDIQLIALDSIAPGFERVDFVKIDVEGMEMQVLRGAQELLRQFRPVIAIEIALANNGAFFDWIDEERYAVINATRMHTGNFNYVCVSRR